MAGYGTVRTYAKLLKNKEKLLEETLEEEAATDEALSEWSVVGGQGLVMQFNGSCPTDH
jgi:ferritin-like metal-binding protein YciE